MKNWVLLVQQPLQIVMLTILCLQLVGICYRSFHFSIKKKHQLYLITHVWTFHQRTNVSSRNGGVRESYRHCRYKTTSLLFPPLASLLIKPPIPANKLNKCLRYQGVIAGILCSRPNYWYFLPHRLDRQHMEVRCVCVCWGGCVGYYFPFAETTPAAELHSLKCLS